MLGGSGLVGSCLLSLWGDRCELVAPAHAQLDVLDGQALEHFVENTPAATIVNVAAWADVDGAESERGDTGGYVNRLNASFPRRLAHLSRLFGKHLVHVSTDYVFDGTNSNTPYSEDDQPNPLGWYAETKLRGEQEVLTSGAEACVARIEMPFTASGHRKLDFARLCVSRLRAGQKIAGVDDQRVTPIFLDDLAAALWRLVDARYTGIIHLAAADWTTPCYFARSIAQRLKLDAELIEPVSFAQFAPTRPAQRPQHPWLDVSRFGDVFGRDILRSVDAELDTWTGQMLDTPSRI